MLCVLIRRSLPRLANNSHEISNLLFFLCKMYKKKIKTSSAAVMIGALTVTERKLFFSIIFMFHSRFHRARYFHASH